VLTRRQLLAGGLAAAGALAVAGVVSEFSADEDRVIVAAIAPVMIGVNVPVEQVVRGFDVALAGLPLEVRGEVRQLFGLLRFPPTRVFVAGIAHPWHSSDAQEIARFLSSWRYSKVAKLRSAYDALHQLILASWYGNEHAWPAIGYPGPPRVA
jgi:hypothetical protein